MKFLPLSTLRIFIIGSIDSVFRAKLVHGPKIAVRSLSVTYHDLSSMNHRSHQARSNISFTNQISQLCFFIPPQLYSGFYSNSGGIEEDLYVRSHRSNALLISGALLFNFPIKKNSKIRCVSFSGVYTHVPSTILEKKEPKEGNDKVIILNT